ncbi:MAG: TIGR01212 family radical SAM protein [Eubacteriales bacterium]|nr:TIGR01212 family radical SAM protein [Eubacteriales bacterium]
MRQKRVLWGEKPYRSLDYELKRQFGEKVYKLSLNGGMTCPNRDGSIGRGGCIFCSAGGSGDFAGGAGASIREQMMEQKLRLEKKHAQKYIAYFQAYTNTYAPVEYLEEIFTEAVKDEEVVALSVATRPDCLPEEVLGLLEGLNRWKPVWVELGLQTIHEDTALRIRRGYELPCFEAAVRELRSRGLEVIVHTILGLPGEDGKRMLQTIEYLNGLDIQGIKLQLLHVLRGTRLGEIYIRQREACDEKDSTDGGQTETAEEFPRIEPLDMEAYIDLVIELLEHLSPEITVHRVTGDGPRELLLAPLWSVQKHKVLNLLHREMKRRESWQGKQQII